MLIFGAVAPHGGDIIPQIAEDPSVMAKTREAMRELGKRFADAQPETVVIATPHGLMVEGAITVGATARAAGILEGRAGKRFKAVFDNDLEFVETLEKRLLQQNVPHVRLIGEEKKREAVLPLDWGALVPLWFTAHPMQARPQIVVLAPDRQLPREVLVRSGVAIAQAADDAGKRVAFIASCDLGHAHDPEGPYGFDPTAAEHDRLFCDVLRTGDFAALLDWSPEFLEAAKVDAYWQTLMLAGALGHTPLVGEFLSYEAPTYFGMAVASYSPAAQ
ncbi:MAG: extradiol dioxygenase [Armatimonadaceae bacterium]